MSSLRRFKDRGFGLRIALANKTPSVKISFSRSTMHKALDRDKQA